MKSISELYGQNNQSSLLVSYLPSLLPNFLHLSFIFVLKKFTIILWVEYHQLRTTDLIHA
jgi:hypothetical protein